MADKETKNKKCPFCGGEAEDWTHQCHDHPMELHNIDCSKCECNLGDYANKEEAIKAWNTRADQSQLEEAKALLVRADSMLNVVSCPACDGGGAIPHGDPHGEPEWQQCQWCDEQSQIKDFLNQGEQEGQG